MSSKPHSPLCEPIPINGKFDLNYLSEAGINRAYIEKAANTHLGQHVYWGMPFQIDKVHILTTDPIEFNFAPIKTRWLCFLHTAQITPPPETAFQVNSLSDWATSGRGTSNYLNKVAATYCILFADGTEDRYDIRYRHQINTGNSGWGENCFQAVPHNAPSVYTHECDIPWGEKQYIHDFTWRAKGDKGLKQWICAWGNPHPEKAIVGVRLEPKFGKVILSALTSSKTQETPIRWERRKKLLLKVPYEVTVDEAPELYRGRNAYQAQYMFLSEARRRLIQLDMGEILSVIPRFAHNNRLWKHSDSIQHGTLVDNEYLVEYVSHPEAKLYVQGAEEVSISQLQETGESPHLKTITSAEQKVTLKLVDKKHQQPVAARIHIHGQYDEYLPPVNRHRMPNSNLFEDYGPELAGPNLHTSTYINGEAVFKLPLGKVYIEVSKGFECKPVHKIVNVTEATTEIFVEIEKVLDWREKGWITADTHVHFLSPNTANLEGAAEGVHVVNLLASQWGELMTNVGDFDGQRTFKHIEGGDDYLVRLGTENRQQVLGHISLLGYQGSMITPLCTGGAEESAIGDPLECLISEWAAQCRKQGGLTVIPHFPQPRAEYAATIVNGLADAVEMHAFWEGIRPYALVDWYRYLSCGYQVPLTGGTDKMMALTEIGRIRTYSHTAINKPLNYERWMDSIRSGNTFVTVGPLIEFFVEGQPAGSRIKLRKTGGQISVTWKAETVKYNMIAVELVINGEIADSKLIEQDKGEGFFETNITRSAWICLLIRGKYTSTSEDVILAHSSAVMVEVEGSELFSACDAISILDQIEGSMAYLDTIGTQAEVRRFHEMQLTLENAYKKLHDRLHKLGYDHTHNITHCHH